MDVSINQMEESLQNVYISNHHNVHIKYCTILFVCYTSIKLGGKKFCSNFTLNYRFWEAQHLSIISSGNPYVVSKFTVDRSVSGYYLTPVILLATIDELLSFISSVGSSISLLLSTQYFQNMFQQIQTILDSKNCAHSNRIFSCVPVSSRLQKYKSFHLIFKIMEKMGWRKKNSKHQAIFQCFSKPFGQIVQQSSVKANI